MKHTWSVVFASFWILCIAPALLLAQITITSSDIQKPTGYVFFTESTDVGSYSVDLGTTGGPQTWDFTGYSTPFSSESEVVNPGGTPFAADFPTSNFCIKLSDEGFSDNAYTYSRVESGGWTWQGFGLDAAESSFVQVWNPQGTIPLPITMGSSWVWEIGWTDSIFGAATTYMNRTHSTVDAWGTMIIPAGSFEVLRTIEYDTSITTISIPPFEFADTTTYIDYTWWSTEPVFIAEVSSREGETNPDYTTADFISVAGGRTGIGDGGTEVPVPRTFALEQNTPNPFNPQTSISFTVPEDASGRVELAVYSLRGQRVRTLVSDTKAPGRYTVAWNGRDDAGRALPSGVYLYRLTAGEQVLTRKMMLAK
jgi:hypothetical protein